MENIDLKKPSPPTEERALPTRRLLSVVVAIEVVDTTGETAGAINGTEVDAGEGTAEGVDGCGSNWALYALMIESSAGVRTIELPQTIALISFVVVI